MEMYHHSPTQPPHTHTPQIQGEGQHQSIPSLGPVFKSNLTICCTTAWGKLENRLLEMTTPDSGAGREGLGSSALNHLDLSPSTTAALGGFTSSPSSREVDFSSKLAGLGQGRGCE